jgi:type II secretory pathway pseudopilin PulG
MKTKGFTLIEIVVASTLLIMLTSMATTTAYNFIQAVAKLKSQFENLRDNISGLYATVSSAKMAYEADLAFAVANGVANPTDPNAQAGLNEAQTELKAWNDSATQINPTNLINVLLTPSPLIKKSPGSYLAPTRVVQFWTHDNNGNPVTTTQTVPIADLDSLFRAYLLTDKNTPDSNDPIVATLMLGRMLDVAKNISPTLPTIDWRRGTTQEILFPAS